MKFLIVSLLLVISVLHSLQTKSQSIDTLIDVGRYKLHFNIVKGSGIPVLFESGGGYDGTVWSEIVKRLHDSIDATLITYDRAGMGKSGIDTNNISILSEVKGLETALSKLSYAKNIFLVAHSFGGAYAILFSARNEKKVKGAVLLDITLPCFMTEEKAKELLEPYKKELPELKEKSIGTYYLLMNYENSVALLSKTSFPPSIPATVISSDSTSFKGQDSILWKACQKALGELPNHHYLLAEKTGHYIHADNPQLVTDEIIKLYRQILGKEKD